MLLCRVEEDVSRKEEVEFPPLSGTKVMLEPESFQGPSKASPDNTVEVELLQALGREGVCKECLREGQAMQNLKLKKFLTIVNPLNYHLAFHKAHQTLQPI